MHVTITNEATVKELNDLLAGELSAIETYGQALEKVGSDFTAKVDLEQCRAAHQDRARRLSDTVTRLGGTPTRSSGMWGSFSKMVQTGAKALGQSATIAALEEGEDHGVRHYRKAVEKLDPDTSKFVANDLLPSQIRTHDTISALKKAQSAK
jgi:uncharacterized protein (TIGR02284 family)